MSAKMSTDDINPYETPKTFERFSDDIRESMRLANREAKRRFSQSIETFHLLTAIALEPTGLGGILFRQYGITGSVVRKQSRSLRVGSEWVTIWGKLPLSANTNRSLDSAITFALIENHDSVGTGGVLLAMLTTDEASTKLLHALEINLDRFEKDLRRYLYRLMIESPGRELQLDPLDATNS